MNQKMIPFAVAVQTLTAAQIEISRLRMELDLVTLDRDRLLLGIDLASVAAELEQRTRER